MNLAFSRLLASTFAFVAVGFVSHAAAQFERGRDYTVLPQPSPVENDGKIEVVEFFHYGCGHCAQLEPKLDAWIKRQPQDVRVMKVPTTFRLQGIDAVTMYYTLQALGQLDRLHSKVFDAIHLDNVMLGNNGTRNGWLQKNGVEPDKYQAVSTSFSMQSRLNRTLQLEKQFNITTVPTLVVAGKYVVPNTNNTLAVVDMLIAMERRANTAPTPAAAPAAAPAKPAAPAATPAKKS